MYLYVYIDLITAKSIKTICTLKYQISDTCKLIIIIILV